MSRNYKHIVLVTDGLKTSDTTNETAFNLARRHDAKVTIVDTIKAPTSAARWFSPNAGDVFEMVLADKTKRLEKLSDAFKNCGVETTSKVLFGKSSEAIAREVIESNADLVVRYMKGVRSKFPGLFGNTARALMRTCPCPLLLVGKNAFDEPKVLASIDAEHVGKENDAIIAEASRMVANSLDLFGVYCWDFYGADLMKKRMSELAFSDAEKQVESMYQKIFQDFKDENDLSCFDDRFTMERGLASEVIPAFCKNRSIDVVTMCSASLNHPFKRLIGSTVESVIDSLPCSLLVVKPVGFISPIHVETVASLES